MAKASNFKSWCTENISPQSWTRICLRCIDIIRDKGYSLKQMEKLDPDVEIDNDLLNALNDALFEFYEMKVNESELEAVG
ncbi:MAG: hypothetical protein AAF600_03395 [Bacteroidota bacterium]